MEPAVIALLATLCVITIVELIVTIRKKDDKTNVFTSINNSLSSLNDLLTRNDKYVREELSRNRVETNNISRENREELQENLKKFQDNQREILTSVSKETRLEQTRALKSFEESFAYNIKTFNERQREQFEDFSTRQNEIRKLIYDQLKEIREETANKLEEMRHIVDENLKDTVEKRFNESFKLISERLEKVHQGLGEMQVLASGVYDLKKVLTNVKMRGNLGEIQLGAILEQMLAPGQYESQYMINANNQDRVDYVIKLPDKNSLTKALLLPIDSKFPMEDFQRFIEAHDACAADDEIKRLSHAFENSVKKCAKSINDKYINPPVTTDFAIMFVPTEALYAEIVRRSDLFEFLQRVFKVTVVGPTNLSAFLNSLQMGFRTLAIERRTNEVWDLLGAVKTEFGKFGNVIERVKKKLDAASKEVDNIGVRSRSIERTLRNVDEIPVENSSLIKQVDFTDIDSDLDINLEE